MEPMAFIGLKNGDVCSELKARAVSGPICHDRPQIRLR
jgi:hypothetical protein